jgi:LCP family protein required for cell wall assembly
MPGRGRPGDDPDRAVRRPARRAPAAPPPWPGHPVEPPVGRTVAVSAPLTAPTAPVDFDDEPTTVSPPPEPDAFDLPPIPLGQRPIEPRVSVTRKPRRGRPGTRPGPPARSARPARPLDRDVAVERDDDPETAGRPPRRSLGAALLATAAATAAPGAGHLILGRKRTGAIVLGLFLMMVGTVVVVAMNLGRTALLENLLSTRTLVTATVALLVVGLLWIAVILRTYLLARPDGLPAGQQTVGAVAVIALCLVVAAPLGFGADLANSQRTFLNDLFPTSSGGTAVAEAIAKPRLNVLLVGSDAGPDRTGTRTDTMMVASIDTRSGRSTLFGLPRNIAYAQFPPDSPMGEEFPDGFHDDSDPTSGDYLLNAVYAYGLQFPELAPPGPTRDPGLNLLHQTVAHMLGLDIDYYVEVNMAGFQSIIDALGGLTVDVGPEPIPIGGISPSGRQVEPDGYIPPGVQQLTGEQALAFARSRTGTTDYARMGRQRCLLQNLLSQKSAADVLTNFQEIASATTDSVATNVPQEVLPALIALAGDGGSLNLESVSFDPNLPDPEENDGRFNTGDPNFPYMREVVQDAIDDAPQPAPSSPPVADATGGAAGAAPPAEEADAAAGGQEEDGSALPSSAPTSLAAACA